LSNINIENLIIFFPKTTITLLNTLKTIINYPKVFLIDLKPLKLI